MKKILVNALSVTNQSGLHVLAGHLRQVALAGVSLVVIARKADRLRDVLGASVEWVDAPEDTARWFWRALWEWRQLEQLAHQVNASWYFTPSGIAASRLSVPQVVLCQNPWCMVSSARRKKYFIKAWIQRRAYKKTMRTATVMAFNSEYMREAYRKNAGFIENRSVIAYQAAEESTRERAQQWATVPRIAGQIACVSAMAPHKNVETLVRAMVELPEATLRLVGHWPDSAYEASIRSIVISLGLNARVFFDGFVPREDLDRTYAESKVFCLMSHCESFGIPAIEAQLFGTPVVCSNACAIPEICGEGGQFCDPNDVGATAAALHVLLSDPVAWDAASTKARLNADRFLWSECSKPLVDLFNGCVLPITVVIPVLNEELNLSACLSALENSFYEVVIVDSGSTDSTSEIAASAGIEVLQFKWDGAFPKKRNWALSNYQFKTQWVLFLDADERVTPQLIEELRCVLPKTQHVGFRISFTNWFQGSPLHYGDVFRKLPLFRVGSGMYEKFPENGWSELDMEVHEHPVLNGSIGELDTRIEHNDFRSLEHYREKHDQYAAWESNRYLWLRSQGEMGWSRLTSRQRFKYRMLKIPGLGVIYFCAAYFFKLGFLDGRAGFALASEKARYFRQIRRRILRDERDSL